MKYRPGAVLAQNGSGKIPDTKVGGATLFPGRYYNRPTTLL